MTSFPIPDISHGIVASARVPNIQKEPDPNGNKDAEIRLKIKLDTNGLTYLLDADLVEKKEIEVEIEEKIEEPPPSVAVPGSAPAEDTVMKDVEPHQAAAQTEQSQPPQQPTPGKKDPPAEGKDVDMKDAEPAAAAAAAKPPQPEPPKVRIRKEKQMRTFYHKVPLEVRYVECTPQEIEKLTQGEEILRADDNYAIETLNSKNKLEAAIFSTRDNLTSIWEKYSQKDEVNLINDYLQTILLWLDEDGSDTTKEEYDNRLKHLQTLLEPILGRLAAELKRIDDERKAEEAKRLEEQKRLEDEKKKAEEEQKRLEEEKKKQQAAATAATAGEQPPQNPGATAGNPAEQQQQAPAPTEQHQRVVPPPRNNV